MEIKQFQDKPLAHYSYAILSDKKIALVDPSRDPKPYYKFAEENDAEIIAVFETHPHADFVSSHLQIHKETGAILYVSKLVGAEYPHTTFDDGDKLKMGKVIFSAINTPGHSPDGITIVAKDEANEHVMFTGDTLFIGDVGRPDLREKAGNMVAKREELAKAMYDTMQNKFNSLPDETIVYPAHGAGSLCGKNMSTDSSSTLGNERMGNWAFKTQTRDEFVNHILADQPFIPGYFGFDVDMNKGGAENFERSISQIPFRLGVSSLDKDIIVIDTRDQDDFKKNHLPNSINIMSRNEDDKIETWLGAIIQPNEPYYLIVDTIDSRQEVLERIAKIGYELQIKAVATLSNEQLEQSDNFDFQAFQNNEDAYTIVDIRNKSEVQEGKFFDHAINVPLNELRESIGIIPTDRPIVVHCAGGYRSAAGSSIIAKEIKAAKVYDLSEKVNEFK
ncbi:MAG: glyoxylase-like metal-dependent hydrolase (beta-lactamase superfamily II) [Sediminicola sp.]|jgi:glyoxylase-like metal-dependent hydrolase (beta-lactamase superfamily II)/rhodanese-related sulfurtransferase